MAGSRSIAVVVGAGGQIGEAIALSLSAHHRLALIDRDAERLAAVCGLLPDDTLSYPVPAQETALVESAFDAIRSAGRIEAVAIAVGTTEGASLDAVTDSQWQQTIDSNLTTVFCVMRASVRAFLAADQGGSICVVGSVHAASPQPGFPAYSVAKAGVAALTKQVAGEYGHRGIRANLVTPGWTAAAHTLARAVDDVAAIGQGTALPELTTPTDIARAVRFLLSADASQVTGADLVIDGGAALLGGLTVTREQYRRKIGLP